MSSPGVGFPVERGEGFLLLPCGARLPAMVLDNQVAPASGLSHKQLIFMGAVRGLHLLKTFVTQGDDIFDRLRASPVQWRQIKGLQSIRRIGILTQFTAIAGPPHHGFEDIPFRPAYLLARGHLSFHGDGLVPLHDGSLGARECGFSARLWH